MHSLVQLAHGGRGECDEKGLLLAAHHWFVDFPPIKQHLRGSTSQQGFRDEATEVTYSETYLFGNTD